VTVPKNQIWTLRSGSRFAQLATKRQQQLACEIARVGRQYFVQTPNKNFPIESHSWLPFVAWLPRRLLVPLLKVSNRFWIKQTSPDFHLLQPEDFETLFPDARIERECLLGLTKSMIAIRSSKG